MTVAIFGVASDFEVEGVPDEDFEDADVDVAAPEFEPTVCF